ncbi:MAG: hypothetical protein U9O78_00605 [Patescibacteria group bacterium]|nr:hypothetical protein [Patescibacteria group bacterium]
MPDKTEKFSRSFLLVALTLFFATLLLLTITLSAQDLGRHIANGQAILSGNFDVLYHNFYSYTLPQNNFVNHHWLGGVIFYLIHLASGFVGLHLFHIFLYCAAFLVLFLLMKRQSSFHISFLLGIAASLFLATRREIRPETFGHLFLAHTLLQINIIIKSQKITSKQFLLFLVQQLFWVNIHISFIFSIICFAVLFLIKVIGNKFAQKIKASIILKLLLLLIAISLVNPNHFRNLLEPLMIFADYGYPLVENKNLLFLHRVINNQLIYSFSAFTLILSILITSNLKKLNLWDLWLALTGVFLGFIALRNIPIFVLFTFPVAAKCIYSLSKKVDLKTDNLSLSKLYLSLTTLVLTITLTLSGAISPKFQLNRLHLGLAQGEEKAAKYFKEHNLTAPIFNNYDVGSYLIFHLSPKIKVFTDNRPEAYSKSFFQNIYIPMQESNKIWQEQLKKYDFKTIFVRRNDITPWFMMFLKQRLNDEQWKIEYEDQFCIIMTRVY